MSNVMPGPQGAGLRGAVDLTALVNRANRPAGTGTAASAGSGALVGAIPVPSLIFPVTDQDFEAVLEISMSVPVIVDLWADWCQPCKQLSPILTKLIGEYGGRLVLATVDVDTNPQLSQAFQAQSIPTVAAVIGGRPVGLFAGAIAEAQVRDVFEQVIQIAEQNGIVGIAEPADGGVAASEAEGPDAEPEPAPLPPHHQEAYDAIERGDYRAAIEAYGTAIAQDPRDALAQAGLAQVRLLDRLQGADAEKLRAAAAAAPADVEAQLAVADLDVAGGHLEDAFARLLDAFLPAEPAGRDAIRQRLLEFFEIAGGEDPRVGRARARLASLLY